MKALSKEEAAKLLSLPTRTRGPGGGTYRTVPGTTKSVRIDLEDRSWTMWWKLPTHAAECTVPKHNEAESPRKHMCVEINGIQVCRRCYLNSLDS